MDGSWRDGFPPLRPVRRSAARQRPPPIAEISCAKVSSCCSTSLRTDLWYLRVSRQQHTLIFFCVDGLRCPLLTDSVEKVPSTGPWQICSKQTDIYDGLLSAS